MKQKLLIIFVIVFLSSCATHKTQVFKSGGENEDPQKKISGVSYLIEEVDSAIQRNLFRKAAETIQRGLRISPNNAELWQRLAIVEFNLGNYQQAEQNALRSIRFSSTDGELIGRNNRLIAAVRELLE